MTLHGVPPAEIKHLLSEKAFVTEKIQICHGDTETQSKSGVMQAKNNGF
jgi:hypothetical protein